MRVVGRAAGHAPTHTASATILRNRQVREGKHQRGRQSCSEDVSQHKRVLLFFAFFCLQLVGFEEAARDVAAHVEVTISLHFAFYISVTSGVISNKKGGL